MTAPARIWIREWPNGAHSVYEDDTEGATAYDCRGCLDATGGVCVAHQKPECTCYEAEHGHQPGCVFNRAREL